MKQYASGCLIEVEVSKQVSQYLFWKNLSKSKKLFLSDSSGGKEFLFFFSRSFVVKQYAAGYLIEVEVRKLVS